MSGTMRRWRASSRGLSHQTRGKSRCFRSYRAVLQGRPPSLDDRIPQPQSVRAQGGISLTGCPSDPQQPSQVESRQRRRMLARPRNPVIRRGLSVAEAPHCEDHDRRDARSSSRLARSSLPSALISFRNSQPCFSGRAQHQIGDQERIHHRRHQQRTLVCKTDLKS